MQIEGATVPYGQKKYEELIESKVRGEDGQRSFAAVLRNRGRRGQTHGSGARTSRPAARAAGQQFRARPATDKIAARRNLAASPRDHVDGCVAGGHSENITPAFHRTSQPASAV